jgi:hypothetical protein
MNENSWASAMLAEPCCAVEDNKLLSAECVKVKGVERLYSVLQKSIAKYWLLENAIDIPFLSPE